MSALDQLREAALSPRRQMDKYLAADKKVVLAGPPFIPEEVVHSMGLIPMAVWGADIQLRESKRYFPAFCCSVAQSILELGIAGAYNGASAIIISSLCDTLKCTGQNWKYAVKDIPFIPMTWPLNRFGQAGKDFAKAGIRRVIDDLCRITGAEFQDESLKESIRVYNAHNRAMRELYAALEKRPLPASDRAAVYKSAQFMPKEAHTALVRELLDELCAAAKGVPVYTAGYLMDGGVLRAFEKNGLDIVGDNIAAHSVQYLTDAPEDMGGLGALAEKWAAARGASVLYDPGKTRADEIVRAAKASGARGVVFLQVKFCDPDEFDYVEVKRACETAGLPIVLIETDRQMTDYAQAETALQAFAEMLG